MQPSTNRPPAATGHAQPAPQGPTARYSPWPPSWPPRPPALRRADTTAATSRWSTSQWAGTYAPRFPSTTAYTSTTTAALASWSTIPWSSRRASTPSTSRRRHPAPARSPPCLALLAMVVAGAMAMALALVMRVTASARATPSALTKGAAMTRRAAAGGTATRTPSGSMVAAWNRRSTPSRRSPATGRLASSTRSSTSRARRAVLGALASPLTSSRTTTSLATAGATRTRTG